MVCLYADLQEMVPGLDLVFLHLTISANQNELRSSVLTFSYYIAECNIVKLSCFAETQKYVKQIRSKL